MIAIDVTLVQVNGNPFNSDDLTPLINDNYVELIEFFNSCVTDSLVLNTVIPTVLGDQEDRPYTTRYYAINTVKATEFQERFMSITSPFSIEEFWTTNGFAQSMTQTQIVFEDKPADQLKDLVDVNDNLLWGVLYPYNTNP